MEQSLIIEKGTTEIYCFPFPKIVFINTVNGENRCIVHTSCYLRPPIGVTAKAEYPDDPDEIAQRKFSKSMEIPMNLGTLWKTYILEQKPKNCSFFRCGQSLIINPDYIRFIDLSEQKLTLGDDTDVYKLGASREGIAKIMGAFVHKYKLSNNFEYETDALFSI